eukprot:423080-Amphidinium_carterae.1
MRFGTSAAVSKAFMMMSIASSALLIRGQSRIALPKPSVKKRNLLRDRPLFFSRFGKWVSLRFNPT